MILTDLHSKDVQRMEQKSCEIRRQAEKKNQTPEQNPETKAIFLGFMSV